MGRERKLTKGQRNDLYKAVEEGGLDINECDLIETYNPVLRGETRSTLPARKTALIKERGYTYGGTVEIKHLPSGSTFSIISWLNDNTYSFSSYQELLYDYGGRVAGEDRSYGSAPGWQKVIGAARRWAENVRSECVDPDFWTELRRGQEFLVKAQSPEAANTPFTPEEQAAIARQLQAIKEYVKGTHSLSIEQAAHVDKRFNQTEAASQRLGRKDWLLLFGGALFSLILSAVVPPEAVHHILVMAAQGLDHLFELEPPP